MEDEDVEKTVLAYLKRKGYKQTEFTLQEEHNRISSSSSYSLSGPARSKNGAARYHDGYNKLRSWAYSLLDLYKLLEDSIEERLVGANSDSEKAVGENKDVDVEDNKKKSADGGKQSAPPKKLKKDKLVGAMGKNVRLETTTISMAPRVKPELTLPAH